MMPVKICGLTREEDVRFCAQAGAAALGFVVEYPVEVPWNLTARRAAALCRAVPEGVAACMVTGGRPGDIIARAKRVRPKVVQLHCEETLVETACIARALRAEGIAVVKALRVNPAGGLEFEIPAPAEAAKRLAETGVAALLVDSGTRERPGGSGLVADMGVYRALAARCPLPVVLAGGLKAENLREVVPRDMPPSGVDVLTGVEAAPGEKDREAVRAFLGAARGLPKRSGNFWSEL